jgi:hypothetical protein
MPPFHPRQLSHARTFIAAEHSSQLRWAHGICSTVKPYLTIKIGPYIFSTGSLSMARDGSLGHVRGAVARPSAAWSAREIELQVLATLAALAQISTPSAAHFLKSHQRLVQKFAADRIGKILIRDIPFRTSGVATSRMADTNGLRSVFLRARTQTISCLSMTPREQAILHRCASSRRERAWCSG